MLGPSIISYYSQAVPVLPRPRARTRMGTTRLHCLRSISVSAVKISVMGLGVYDWFAMVSISMMVRYVKQRMGMAKYCNKID